ncbi:hypothetical protein MLD38_033579 [Melastoma candidum]|uniref:Uncharacterized protein n=1 Tax=Melastoma candidum TaxID=119954 RepID=A0ACB9MBK5_9MYRT|nr:hypothetical protein MLD38_033579 [Melastoma candidum]
MEILGPTGEEASFAIDPDYEFDVAQFFDFTRPETRSEEEEAERWFNYAPAYPPSPFAARAFWGVPASLDNSKKSQDLHRQEDERPTISDDEAEGDAPASRTGHCNDDKDPPPRGRPKLQSGYMKPTASYLAKQNHIQDFHFRRILRSPAIDRDHKTSSHSSSSNEMQAAKRQKLDAGYLQKINHVKPRSPLQHKAAKMERKIDERVSGKPKITVPREFSLETARRAVRHRSKNESNSIGQHSVEKLKIPAAKQPPVVKLFKYLSIDPETRPHLRNQFPSCISSAEMVDAATEKPSRSCVKQFQYISDYRSQGSFNRSLGIR